MNRPMARPRRILFLFSDTGGGHRSAAEAIIEALNLEYGNQIEAGMVDIFRQYSPPPFSSAPEIYTRLARMPQVWRLSYKISDGNRRARIAYSMIWPYLSRSIYRLVREHPVDLFVSVHQLINAPVARVLSSFKIPFVTVVTDMVSTHAAWFDRRAKEVIVPTALARQRALQMGLRPEQVVEIGMPVAERFRQVVAGREEIRRQLGWPQDEAVALLVGGGEGMGPLDKVAFAIDQAKLPVNLALVTGRNWSLCTRLEKHRWQTPVKLYGFVREMPQFMRAADILITKAGPGTISEGFISGLPLVLYSKMPGQEDGNVAYVVSQGAGVWAPHPSAVVKTLKKWLAFPEEMAKVASISSRLARPDASRQIARRLARFLD